MRYSFVTSLLVAASTVIAAPAGPVGQIPDGQIQGYPVSQIGDGQVQAAPPKSSPISQIGDGQVQASAPKSSPVSQIGDGQVQAGAPKSSPVSQIGDGQVQASAPKPSPVSQIADGQIQAGAPKASPVSQIADGQVQAAAPQGSPVSQIADGQIQAGAPKGSPVSQIADGQIQAAGPQGSPVTQIGDGQVQAAAPKGSPVTQIADGQVQAAAPMGSPVTQIADGQVQAPAPQGSPVTQIADGQVQAPKSSPVTQIADGQVQSQGAAPAAPAPAPAPAAACPYGMPPAKSGGNGKGAQGPQVPFKFPLDNGFPTSVDNATILAIEKQAHGTLPNSPLPTKLSDESAATLQLIAFNELFEVGFFTSVLRNITEGTFDAGTGAVKTFVVNALTAIQGQEQLHALGANAILTSAGRTPIQPCEYVFPSTDFDTAIATANLFTDVVVGTLGSAQHTFATTGDAALIPLVSSIVGQESEQIGWFRTLGMKTPSALPFLTGGSGVFAFSALNQLFIAPGTCGNLQDVPLPILQPLTVVTSPVEAKDQEIAFSYPIDPSIKDPSGLRLVYINQQNLPIVEELKSLKVEGNTVSFTASFPYTEYIMNGLTVAAVTNGKTSFASPDEVAAAAVWGPGLIEIN